MTTDYQGHDAPAADWLPRQPARVVPMLLLGHSDEHLAELADRVAREALEAGYRAGHRHGLQHGRTFGFLAGWLVGGLITLAASLL